MPDPSLAGLVQAAFSSWVSPLSALPAMRDIGVVNVWTALVTVHVAYMIFKKFRL